MSTKPVPLKDVAQSVWDCIQAYNSDAAKRLLKRYHHSSAAIVLQLQSYPGRNKYHGHCSGEEGEGTNKGADDNRRAAIAYLDEHAPTQEENKTGKGPNTSLKKASLKKSQDLIAIIKNNDNLGTIQTLLDTANPNWREIRLVKQAYEWKRKEKKEKLKQKK
jgi:hypothetical protein